MRLIIGMIVLISGCGNPVIQPDGIGCDWYGVDTDQNSPMGCPVDGDDIPVVELVNKRALKQRCGNDKYRHAFAWGCVERDGIVAINDSDVIRHEICHCILGAKHTARHAILR